MADEISNLPGNFKSVTIEERWGKEGTNVYRYWRFAPNGKWKMELTPYVEIPYVKLKDFPYDGER